MDQDLTAVLSVAPLEREPALLAGLADRRVVRIAAGAVDTLFTMNAGVISVAAGEGDAFVVACDANGSAEYRRLADDMPGVSLTWANKLRTVIALDEDRYAGVDARATAVTWVREGEGFTATQLRRNCNDLALRDDGLVVLTSALSWLLWDPATSSFTAPFPTVDGMQLSQQNGSAGVSRNGRFFFVYWDQFLLFDTASGALLREGRSPWYVHATSISDDGRFLAIGGKEGWVGVMDEQGELAFDGTVSDVDVHEVRITRDGSRAAWRDRRGRVGLIDVG